MRAWVSDYELEQAETALSREIKLNQELEKSESLLADMERRDNAMKIVFDAADEAVQAYNKLKENNG